jgi:hypothetical protein
MEKFLVSEEKRKGSATELTDSAIIQTERLTIKSPIFLTEQINDSVVVAGEQSDEISEEKHEGAVDNPVVQVGGGYFKILLNVDHCN